jgi:hypothetical protein
MFAVVSSRFGAASRPGAVAMLPSSGCGASLQARVCGGRRRFARCQRFLMCPLWIGFAGAVGDVSMLQFAENLNGRLAARAVARPTDWKYPLGVAE